jgi:predicted RNA methylase
MLQRFLRAYRRHELKDIPGLILKNVRHAWTHFSEPSTPHPSEFDVTYHVETDSIRETGSLNIDSPNAKHAVRYEPSPSGMVRSILSTLALDWPRYTFVDFGAGKGRVLLLAAELPFKSIIGVEFSPELAEQANNNIASYQAQTDSSARISCLCLDAVDFRFPEDPLVCYFYNPFGYPVLEPVLSNLLSSHARSGRDIYVIYVHPVHRAEIKRRNPVLVPIREEDGLVICHAGKDAPGKSIQ